MTHSPPPTELPEDLFLNVLPRETWIRPAQKHIVLYGAGGLGRLAAELLTSADIRPEYFVDLHSQARELLGIPVYSAKRIPAPRSDTTVLVCVVTSPFLPIRQLLHELGFADVRPFYDFAELLIDKLHITNGWLAPELSVQEQTAIASVYRQLADDASRAAYLQMLYWRIRREEVSFEINAVTMQNKWFPEEIREVLHQKEILVDGGAYTGEVMETFLAQVQNQFAHIFAFEPDAENFSALEKQRAMLPHSISEQISLHHFALSSQSGQIAFMAGRNMASFASPKGETKTQATSLDEQEINATFVKLHVEGSELDALNGGVRCLNKNRPLLAITIYHNADGLWRIPLFVMEQLPNYRFFIHTHAWCGISSILYGIPVERHCA